MDKQPVRDSDDWSTKPVRVKDVTYDKALSVEAGCSARQLDYVLDGGYSQFHAMVGMANDSPETGTLDFYVLADDEQVKKISGVGIGTLQTVDVSVVGVSRLAIGVEGDPWCGHRVGVWIDPSLTPVNP